MKAKTAVNAGVLKALKKIERETWKAIEKARMDIRKEVP